MKMRNTLLAAVAFVAIAGCVCVKTADTCAESLETAYPASIDEGFVPLSEGHGMIYGEGNPITEKEYGNFILRLEFLMPENGNNGLGIRTPDSKVDAAYHGMCELQLLDDGGSSYYDAADGKDKLKPYQYTGSVYGIVPSLRDNKDKQIWGKEKNFTAGGSYVRKPGMWNFEEVKVIGSEIEVYLNGYLITKADVSKFKGDGTDTPDGKKHRGLHNKKGHIG